MCERENMIDIIFERDNSKYIEKEKEYFFISRIKSSSLITFKRKYLFIPKHDQRKDATIN